jgi:hypothetical protein
MSASEHQRAEGLDPAFWERLDRLEGRHQRVQSEHDSARRSLECQMPREAEELRRAWWADQEYRVAVRRLAQFCLERRDGSHARARSL